MKQADRRSKKGQGLEQGEREERSRQGKEVLTDQNSAFPSVNRGPTGVLFPCLKDCSSDAGAQIQIPAEPTVPAAGPQQLPHLCALSFSSVKWDDNSISLTGGFME